MGGFPPFPSSFVGRKRELDDLVRLVRAEHPTALALVGAGGSGKTTIAAALGHRLRRFFGGRLDWVRVGAWDRATVVQMLSLQLGCRFEGSGLARVERSLIQRGPSFVVLDNHEDDRVTAGILDALRGAPVTWVVTARRCLLGGVTIVPVAPARVEARLAPFPRVASLTRLLRSHPVALDIADALVSSGVAPLDGLERRLRARGVGRIRPIEHEDDLPEVRAVVGEAFRALSPDGKRLLAILAGMGGDSMSTQTLLAIGKAKRDALEELSSLRVSQRPGPDRHTVHATVRYALKKIVRSDPSDRIARHYLAMFARAPETMLDEPTQVYALLDWAQDRKELSTSLRVQSLAAELERMSAERPSLGRSRESR